MPETIIDIINRYDKTNRIEDIRNIKRRLVKSPKKYIDELLLIKRIENDFYDVEYDKNSEKSEKNEIKTIKHADYESDGDINDCFCHPKQYAKSIRKNKLLIVGFDNLKVGEIINYRINGRKSNKIKEGVFLGTYKDIFLVSKTDKMTHILLKTKYIILK